MKSEERIEAKIPFSLDDTRITCKDGNHPGVNNTTGRCPICGEQLEHPSASGFSKAIWNSPKYECLDCGHTGYPEWVHNDDKCAKCYSGRIVAVSV